MTSAQATFFLRLGSTLTLWLVILAGIFSGFELAFFLLIAGLSLTALWEYFRMLEQNGIPVFKGTGMLAALVFLSVSFYYFSILGPTHAYDLELAVTVVFLIGVCTRQMFRRTRDEEPLRTMAYTLFGLLYIPWMFNFVSKIVFIAPRAPDGATTGQYYALFLVMVTKFSDMGAYAFGSLFGKHPFAPHISPKKTWEGFAGAIGSALLASFLLYTWIPERLPAFRFTDVAVLGLLLGFGAVIGDLAESIVKRSAHAKDSSHVVPGIGGTLDLIDSLLFTAPLLFFYMRMVLHMP